MKRVKTDRFHDLKVLAGKQQYLLHDQIETFLDESASVEDMDEVYIALNDLKVDVFDTHEEAQQKLKIKRKDEKRPAEKQVLPHPMRYDDPVRMYLREMGRVPLLDREGEVEIAKRIKAGERQICTALFRCTPILKELIGWGAGPRACQQWILGGKVRAVLQGRFHVTLDDVVALAVPVLRHRIVPTFNAEAEGITVDEIIQKILDATPRGDAKKVL